MRILFLMIIYLCCLPLVVNGQRIEVVDGNTGAGIENVAIYNLEMNKSIQTDARGMADLSIFSKEDVLNFQHPSYHEKTLPIGSIPSTGIQIRLEEKIIKIDEVIISASKWEQNPEVIANTVTRINQKTIDFENPPTSADLLEESGQVFVQKSQLGGGSPMIRGFSANRLLIVVDGVRMNNAIYRSGNLQNVISVDVNALEEAEVLFGPGSVIYGSDALGGVMDFHTRTPLLSVLDDLRIQGNAVLRYATAANEKTFHGDLSIGGRKFSSLTSFSFSGFDDLVTGNKRTKEFPDYGKRTEYVERINGRDSILSNPDYNQQKFSGYSQYNLIQKFRLRPGDHLDLDYGFYFSNTSNIPRYDRLILYDEDSLPENSEWYYGPQTWMMNRISTSLYKANSLYTEARIIISYQLVKESRFDRKFRDNLLRKRAEKVNIINFNADFDKTFNGDHQLYYGLDFSFNRVSSGASVTNIESDETSTTSTRYPDGGSNYGFLAFYANYLWLINPVHSLNAGVRYTQSGLTARLEDQSEIDFDFNSFSNNNGALNGSLGWVIRPGSGTKIDFIASSGFRAPNVDDMGKLFDSEPGYVIVPNKELQPEFAYNLEAGLTQGIGENLELHIVGFYTWLTDAMVRRDFRFNGQDSLFYDGALRKVQALVNTGRANIYGFSFVFKGDITSYLGVFSTLNYTYGRDVTMDEPLRHAAPIFGKTAFYFRKKGFLGELSVNYSGRKKYEDLSPSEKNKLYLYTPEGALAWYTLNLMASYEFRDAFLINFGIENIINKHYRTYSSGISAPGRNFIVGMHVQF